MTVFQAALVGLTAYLVAGVWLATYVWQWGATAGTLAACERQSGTAAPHLHRLRVYSGLTVIGWPVAVPLLAQAARRFGRSGA